MTLAIAIVAAVGVAYLLDWLRFPAGGLIGAMVVIAGFKLSGVVVPEVPGAVRFVALVVIGWDLGTKFNKQLLATVADNLIPLVSVVVAFLVIGWILAWILWRAGLMDPVTAILDLPGWARANGGPHFRAGGERRPRGRFSPPSHHRCVAVRPAREPLRRDLTGARAVPATFLGPRG
jgi:hypothetical protein